MTIDNHSAVKDVKRQAYMKPKAVTENFYLIQRLGQNWNLLSNNKLQIARVAV